MPVENCTRRILLSATAVVALVGQRVTPRLVQGDSLPALTFGRVSTPEIPHAMGSTPSLKKVRMQVDSYATSYLDAKTLSGRVKTALSRYRGTVTGEVVQDVFYANEIDMTEERGQDELLYRVSQDFMVWHEG